MSCVFQWSLPDGSANYKSVKPLPLQSVAIIGLGTMGTGIAWATLNAGIPVILIEYNKQVITVSSIRVRHSHHRDTMQQAGYCCCFYWDIPIIIRHDAVQRTGDCCVFC